MTDNPIVGSIGVAVVPNADQFWVRFKQQTEAGADQAGRDAGKRLSDGIGSQGDNAGRQFKARLELALRNLPEARIDVNTSAAEAKLAALGAQIGAVGDAGNSGAQSFNALFAAAVTVGPALIPLGSGLAGLATSLIGIGTTGELAFKGIQAEIAANTVVGKRYTASLGDMKAGLAALETTAASGFLGGFEKSVGKITAQMPQLNAFIGQTSNVLGDLAAHGAGALISLFTALEPVILQSMHAVDQLAARFEAWASGPGGAKLFAQFGSDIPLAVAAIGSLAIGAAHLVEAFAPIGTVLLGAISGVSHALALIPVPVLAALATAFVATKIAGLASLGITTLAAKANIELAGSANLAAAAEERLALASGATVGRMGLLVGGLRTIVPAYIVATLAAGALAQSTKGWADSQNAALRTLHAGLDGIKDVLHGKFTLPSVFGDVSAQDAVRQAQADQKALDAYFTHLNASVADETRILNAQGPQMAAAYQKLLDATSPNASFQASAGGKYAASVDKANSGQLGLIDRSSSLSAATDALAQYGAALQKNIDMERAWLNQGKQTVEIQGLGAVGAKTWEAALAATNGVYPDAINLIRGHQDALHSDTEAQAEAALQQAQTAHFLADAASNYGLTTAQTDLYTRAVGLNVDALGTTPAALAGAEAALKLVVNELRNGTSATDGWLAAVAKFDSAGDTAAARGALIGSALRAANGDLLAFTGSMTGVTSANFALTNAFQDQAAAAVSASRAVAQAQDGVTAALDQQQIAEGTLATAQLSAVSAQRALTSARVDATRALQDLHNQAIDGALAERRAVLDLAAAQAAENKAPSASNALSLDEARQRLEEIRLANKRLAVDKAAADKAGVEGSKQVVSAQAGIVSALKAVSEAQKQQLTAAKGVLAAQQAVTDAAAAQAKALATSERAAIDAKTGLIDYSKQGAAPLVTQLQAVQDAAEKAASATYQHEYATGKSKQAADDAVKVYQNQTRGALIDEAKQLGLTKDQAKKFADQYFGLANAGDLKKNIALIGTDQVTKSLQGILADLDIISGKTKLKVTADTSQATKGVTALLKLMGTLPSGAPKTGGVPIDLPGINHANGAVVDYYANGGVNKFADGAHIAQIAPAGAMRLWAEPETGGEAYIPLAAAKRQRSEQILADVASRFGGQYQPPGGALKSGGDRSVVVQQTIHNPVPEMASVSGPTGLRRAAYALGNF